MVTNEARQRVPGRCRYSVCILSSHATTTAMRKVVIGLAIFFAAVAAVAELSTPPQSSSPAVQPAEFSPATGTAPSSPAVTERENTPESYWTASDLIVKNDLPAAQAVLEKALADYPDNYHLQMLLAEVRWTFYSEPAHRKADLDAAAHEVTKAVEFSLAKGEVDYTLDAMAATILGQEGDLATIDSLFAEVLAHDRSYTSYLNYAHALSEAGDPRAEGLFKAAIGVEGDQAPDATSQYSEWLLRQGRNAEVVALTDSGDAGLAYLSFLRGVALERLGRLDEARKAYEVYVPYAQALPVSPDFAIPKSSLQKGAGIEFSPGGYSPGGATSSPQASTEVLTPKALSDSQALRGFSYLIGGEAGNQVQGAMRAEGWVVRNRVLRGSAGPNGSCPTIPEDFSALLADRYKFVICQGSGAQFNGIKACLSWCSNPNYICPAQPSPLVQQVAFNVYYGFEPDPVASYCPGGVMTWGGNYCAASTRCLGDTFTYLLFGSVFNYGSPFTCPANPPACNTQVSMGKVCATSASANCFYSQPNWGQGPTYSGLITAGGSNVAAFFPNNTYYYSTKSLQRAHVEGSPGLKTYLVLWHWTGQWQVAAITQALGANDITFSVPSWWPSYYRYYEWEVYAAQGSGLFFIALSNP